jgi:hypothetical protein
MKAGKGDGRSDFFWNPNGFRKRAIHPAAGDRHLDIGNL